MYSNTTLVKVNLHYHLSPYILGVNSNTTLVKVNQVSKEIYLGNLIYSNTTLVKVNLMVVFPTPPF